MITLTDKAALKVKELLQRDNKTGSALRMSVREGGCCNGFTYTLDFDTHQDEQDRNFEQKGIRIVVDAISYPYLAGAEVDYIEDLTGSGFTFTNPNARSTCGCGSSFQA
jgi:iron-sulfur cluster assembly protein